MVGRGFCALGCCWLVLGGGVGGGFAATKVRPHEAQNLAFSPTVAPHLGQTLGLDKSHSCHKGGKWYICNPGGEALGLNSLAAMRWEKLSVKYVRQA